MEKTFYSFFKGHNIKIPIIQRDYAQGRDSDKAKNVRTHLIGAMKYALDTGRILDLNFVYGTEEKESVSTFLPVDGQQRLTTLYLLHYFIFVVSGHKDEMSECGVFSYETRSSALEFFAWLRKADDGLCQALTDNEDLKKLVLDMPEYQAAWNNDPTVASAINMLTEIKKQFGTDEKVLNKYCEKLMGIDCPIRFSVISDKNTGTSARDNADKTYIRMNARGKKLEDFENLRASVDGIRDQIKDVTWNNDLILKYDQAYLNSLFNAFNGKGTNNIFSITGLINKRSGYLFKNVFNIVSFWKEKGICYKPNYSDYRYFIYDCAKTVEKDQGDGFRIYIDMLDSFFQYCLTDPNEYDSRIFTDQNYITEDNEYKQCEAKVLYCYFYYTEHETVPTKDQLETMLYVLDNLNCKEWGNIHNNLRNFCKAISSDKKGVISYFASEDSIKQLNNSLSDINIDDCYVRLKEQQIKAGIILENSLNDRYFEEYEKSTEKRKLQILLYAAGYWEAFDNGDFKDLEDYISKAQKWKFTGALAELDYRKYYAITSCMKEDNDTLKSAEDINKESEQNKHIWDYSLCFWNDTYENDNFEKVKEDRKILVRTLKMDQSCFDKAKDVLRGGAYDKCWIKYAVELEHIELLKLEIKKSADGDLLIHTNYDDRLYFLYVVQLEKKGWNLQWGDDFNRSNYYVTDGLWDNVSCSGSHIEKRSEDYSFSLGGIRRTLKNGENEVEIYVDKDTYNMKTRYIDRIKIEPEVKNCECLVYLREEDTNGKHSYYYERYVYDHDNPIVLHHYSYDVTDKLKELRERYSREEENLKGFNIDDYLYMYGIKHEMINADKKYDRTDGYNSGDLRTHTWTKCSKIEINVGTPTDCLMEDLISPK